MPDEPNGVDDRYLVVVDPTANMEAVTAELEANGLKIDSRLDVIRTLVVAGDAATATAATKVKGVRSVEREGTVRTQD